MTYDFTSIIDRHGKDALAVDGLGGAHWGIAPDAPQDGFDAIPMWVADMNFATVPTITDAIITRAQHPAFGYFEPTDEYFNAIIDWQRSRNGVEGLTREAIGYENGVLGGVISTLTSFAAPGDAVLLHSPTYVGFTRSIESNGYHIVHSPLVRDGQGVWRMDFEDMDRKLKEHQIHVAVFCSPHNPCGRVWERWEIERAMEVYRANPALRDRVVSKGAKSHYNDMNVLSMHALVGAYSPEGHAWLDELRAVLTGNVDYACDYIAEHFAGIDVFKPEGTYMLLLDCTQWCAEHHESIDEVEHRAWKVGVAVQDGRQFNAPCALRVNLALPLSLVKEAMARLSTYVFINA
jgi:cystathionine beta-lyase